MLPIPKNVYILKKIKAMKPFILSCFFIAFLFVNTCFSQVQQINSNSNETNQYKEICFVIIGFNDNNQLSEVKKTLLNDNNIKSVELFPDGKYFVSVINDINIEYINNILQQLNLGYDKKSVAIKYPNTNEYIDYSPKEIIISDTDGNINKDLPADFPKKINTGNIKEDEHKYYEAIQSWIEIHPEEWEQMNENRKKK